MGAMRKILLSFVGYFAMAASASEGLGAEFCVSNAIELQSALDAAKTNGQDDLIKVVQGLYRGNFVFDSSEGRGLYLEGGYTAGCTSRILDPANTVLDGGGNDRVLYLENTSGGAISIEGFTIQQGGRSAGTLVGGGIYARSYSFAGTAGPIVINKNIVTGNVRSSAGGVYAESASYSGDAGHVTFADNIIVGNTSEDGSAGGVYAKSSSISGNTGNLIFLNNVIARNRAIKGDGGGLIAYVDGSGQIIMINNTITENHAVRKNGSVPYGGGVCMGVDQGQVHCYNNIIWGNTALHVKDLYLVRGLQGSAYAYNNAVGDWEVSRWNGTGNNINQDPLFVNPAGGDYRLRPGSPCIDAGNDSPSGGLPNYDFEGDPRTVNGKVDIGADEYNLISHCVSDAAELQAALTAAQSNNKSDMIMVVQGFYQRSGNFNYSSSQGHSITLQGGYTPGCTGRVHNPATTVLDGNNSGRVLYLYDSKGGDISVDGFTIQGGSSNGSGGGVFAWSYSSSITAGRMSFTNNIVRRNSANWGGGVYVSSDSGGLGAGGNITFVNNIVTGNSANYGGGVFAQSSSTSGMAGGITFTNNSVTGNQAGNLGGGVDLYVYGRRGAGPVFFSNNISWGNTAPTGGDVFLDQEGGITRAFNNDIGTWGGKTWDYGWGSIDADPLFVDPDAGDYHLSPGSPCIDAGYESAPGIPVTDLEGDSRVIDGDNSYGARVDIGADEYNGFPRDNTVFSGCSIINGYQTTFAWVGLNGPFKSFTIYFSTSPVDFATKGSLIAKAKVAGTRTTWIPSMRIWKKILVASYNGGSYTPIYWKVVGQRADKSTEESGVREFILGSPDPPDISQPRDGALLPASVPPAFEFWANCNTKFRLEFSPLLDFGDPKRIMNINWKLKDPNAYPVLNRALSSRQWAAVRKLISSNPGYFRMRAWDALKRETISETRSFSITP